MLEEILIYISDCVISSMIYISFFLR